MPESPIAEIGVIIVDHGSRRDESNAMLHEVVELFRRSGGYAIVEAAHMELAEPSLETAFDRCVARGARLVAVHPYFLLPGTHWDRDIPQLAAAAASRHPGVQFVVTAPLGVHPLMAQIIRDRLDHCLAHAAGRAPACNLCSGTDRCRLEAAGGSD